MPLKRFIIIVVALLCMLAVLVIGIYPTALNGLLGTTGSSNQDVLIKNSPTPEPPELKRQRAMDEFSVDRMIDFLEELTAINPYGGWRGSATQGEALAFEMVEADLNQMDWLLAQGMTLETETFHVFAATQDHASSLWLTVNGTRVEIPASTLRGHRDNLNLVMQMDSDGSLADTDPDPVEQSGEIVLIQSREELDGLAGSDLSGRIALVDYALVDTSIKQMFHPAESAEAILALRPAAVILFTSYSNSEGQSHGTYLGDGGGGFQLAQYDQPTPVLFITLEDLTKQGITTVEDLALGATAEVVWDVDVNNPGSSQNLIVHIPGRSGAKPVLISAHLDSAHSPGGLDDGSGSAILMEIATVLNEGKIQPEVDLYLVWFGSEEIGLVGSAYFTTTHSELVNDLQANIQVDCLTRPLENLNGVINLSFSNYLTQKLSDDPLAKYLTSQATGMDFETASTYWPYSSDNGNFTAFNIPNVNIVFEDEAMSKVYGGVWYSGQLHSPYDTVERVAEMKPVFEQMGRLALSGVFNPLEDQGFRSSPQNKKALFIASHTEAPQMSPAGLPFFGISLVEAGYELNVLPFGSQLTEENLEGVDLVVVLPPYDYPANADTDAAYDVGWTSEEAEAINDYTQDGGVVLVVNSGYRVKYFNRLTEVNEDWSELNVLTEPWGVRFFTVGGGSNSVRAVLNGEDVYMNIMKENAVRFTAPGSAILAGAAEDAYLAELKVGSGRVIILADYTALGENPAGQVNRELIEMLVR